MKVFGSYWVPYCAALSDLSLDIPPSLNSSAGLANVRKNGVETKDRCFKQAQLLFSRDFFRFQIFDNGSCRDCGFIPLYDFEILPRHEESKGETMKRITRASETSKHDGAHKIQQFSSTNLCHTIHLSTQNFSAAGLISNSCVQSSGSC